MKVDKLTQLFEEQDSFKDWSGKIKYLDLHLLLDIDGKLHWYAGKDKKKIKQIVNDYNDPSTEYFLMRNLQHFSISPKSFKKDHKFKDGQYDDGHIQLSKVYEIGFKDSSYATAYYSADDNFPELQVVQKGMPGYTDLLSHQFKKKWQDKQLNITKEDLDNWGNIELPKTTKPKIEID